MRSYPLKPTVPLPTTTDVGTGDKPGGRGASWAAIVHKNREGGWVARGCTRNLKTIQVYLCGK